MVEQRQPDLPVLQLPPSKFSFVTEFRLRQDGWIERRTVYVDGRPVKDTLGEWEKIEPEGIELSRQYIPQFDAWLRELNWRAPVRAE